MKMVCPMMAVWEGRQIEGKAGNGLPGRVHPGKTGGFMEIRKERLSAAGSMTVEAAFVLPITFYALFAFLYLFLVMQTELEVVRYANEYVTTLQRYGAFYEQLRNRASTGEEESFLSELGFDSLIGTVADSVFLSLRFGQRMKDSPYLALIRYGCEGFDCAGSRLLADEGILDIQICYTVKCPFSVWGIGDRKIVYRTRAKAFSGADTIDRATETENETADTTVYLTKSGEVYHLDRRCTYLKTSLRKVLRSNLPNERSSDGSVYYPCEACGDTENTVYVYLCSWGVRYHTDPECSKIYHEVSELLLSEAEEKGLRACSKCAAGKDN